MCGDVMTRKLYPNYRRDSKVHGAYMGPTWGRQDPGGPQVDPMILAIWVAFCGVTCGFSSQKVETLMFFFDIRCGTNSIVFCDLWRHDVHVMPLYMYILLWYSFLPLS